MEIKQKDIRVTGMTCYSCNKTIEKQLSKLEGIEKVKADYQSNTVSVSYYGDHISEQVIQDKLMSLGYPVKNKQKIWNMLLYMVLGMVILSIVMGANIWNQIPIIDEQIGYGLLFATGVLTSIHCIAMCGGIGLSLTSKDKKKSIATTPFWYNLGRLTSYSIIGGVVGLFGSVIAFSDTMKNIVFIVSGIFMMGMGFSMSNVFSNKKWFQIKVPSIVRNTIQTLKNKTKSPYIIGVLNGFMPCGPLQSMQVYALGTGSLIAGAFSMFVFALGTIPLMFLFGLLGGYLNGKTTFILKRVSAVAIIGLGVVMFQRGYDISFEKPSQDYSKAIVAVKKDGYQEVNMDMTYGIYREIVVEKNVPVKWMITAGFRELNGCNEELIAKEFDLTYQLQTGANEVEFLPTKIGSYNYHCWMNMIKSKIHVVDDLSDITA